MPAQVTEREFKAVLRLRTKEARKAAGFTQEKMAQLLHVDLATYKKWENRENSTLRIDKIESFCLIVRLDPAALLSMPTRDELALLRPEEKRRTA